LELIKELYYDARPNKSQDVKRHCILCVVLHNLDKIYDLTEVSSRFDCNTFQAKPFLCSCNKLRTIAVCKRIILNPVFLGRFKYTSGHWTRTQASPLFSSKLLLLFRVFIYFSFVFFLFFSSTLCFTEQLVVKVSANGKYVLLLLSSYPVTNNINQRKKMFIYIYIYIYF